MKWLFMWLSHYMSTYCFHGEHGQCRLTCKVCDRRCRCRCHKRRHGYRW